MTTFLKNLVHAFRSPSTTSAAKTRPSHRPTVRALEERAVPSVTTDVVHIQQDFNYMAGFYQFASDYSTIRNDVSHLASAVQSGQVAPAAYQLQNDMLQSQRRFGTFAPLVSNDPGIQSDVRALLNDLSGYGSSSAGSAYGSQTYGPPGGGSYYTGSPNLFAGIMNSGLGSSNHFIQAILSSAQQLGYDVQNQILGGRNLGGSAHQSLLGTILGYGDTSNGMAQPSYLQGVDHAFANYAQSSLGLGNTYQTPSFHFYQSDSPGIFSGGLRPSSILGLGGYHIPLYQFAGSQGD